MTALFPIITVNVLKFRTPKKKEHPKFILTSPLIASLCKIGYFPHRIFRIFLFKIKILLYEFLEHLTYYKWLKTNSPIYAFTTYS